MIKKNILLFIGGVVVGGAAGIFGTRSFLIKKYDKRLEQWEDEMQKYYGRTDEYARVSHDENEEDQNEESSKEPTSRPGGGMTPEERARTKEMLQKNYEQTTNYAAMYRSSETDPINDPAESEHPEEEEKPNCLCSTCVMYEEEDPVAGVGHCRAWGEATCREDACSDWKSADDQNEIDEEQAFDEHRKNINKPPKIISVDDYSNLPAHIDQQVLYFYSYDEMLCDENEEMIEDPGLLVGDTLTKYDFAGSDERCIFVMNYATDTCYEIQKVDAFWTDSH